MIAFIAGFFVRTFIPTSKERFDMEAHRAKTSRELVSQRDQAYQKLVPSLSKMAAMKRSADHGAAETAFWELRSAADNYFAALDMIAAFIRKGEIDSASAHDHHMPELEKVAFKIVPLYYSLIAEVAAIHNLPLTDRLDDSTMRNVRLVLKGHLPTERYLALLDSWGVRDDVSLAPTNRPRI